MDIEKRIKGREKIGKEAREEKEREGEERQKRNKH